MIFRDTNLSGATVIELERLVDDRGFFARSYADDEFGPRGLPTRWPQSNLSRNNRRHTLRGMHYNAAPHREAKLVRCVRGAIWDAIVDLRVGSLTRFKWFGVELTAEAGNALFVPEGFAHGFVTLTDDADVLYQMTAVYAGGAGRGLRFDDPLIGITWPAKPAFINERDRTYPDFDAVKFDG
ncbi:MAG TPA: dTDP-4-dehydrorhamnose 3,5-epimerase family protein [Polyangia bacterium]|nr:dTDP-4-dehydrorhamnose 3,5-epimerase family protein [Polyangia bacterium]